MTTSEVLERFGDLRFDLELEVGSFQMTVGEMLDLKEGMVLKTDHPSGQPFAVLAGGAELGMGNIVVLGDSCSVKIATLAKPMQSARSDGTN